MSSIKDTAFQTHYIMKKTYFLLFLTASLLFCSCHSEKQTKILDVTEYNRKSISMEEIGQLRNDTLHHKVIMFVSNTCGGCLYETKNYFVPAQKMADTTRWKFYYILRETPKSLHEIEEIEATFKSLGVDTSDLYFFAEEAQIEFSVEADNAMYHQVLSYFKQAHELGTIDGIPQSFIIERHGNLVIDKEKYADRDSTWYRARMVSPSHLIEEEFSIELLSVIVREQIGHGKDATIFVAE